jgi:hypothetical protein
MLSRRGMTTIGLSAPGAMLAGEQVANFVVDGFLRPADEVAPMVFGLLAEDLDHAQFGTIRR